MVQISKSLITNYRQSICNGRSNPNSIIVMTFLWYPGYNILQYNVLISWPDLLLKCYCDNSFFVHAKYVSWYLFVLRNPAFPTCLTCIHPDFLIFLCTRFAHLEDIFFSFICCPFILLIDTVGSHTDLPSIVITSWFIVFMCYHNHCYCYCWLIMI